jgi:hypothetical protein
VTECALQELVGAALGSSAAQELVAGLDLDARLLAPASGDRVPRAVLAEALAALLFADLLTRVPSAAAYVAEKWGRSERVHLDHGAVRTVAGVDCGELPAGQESVTRVLAALGYAHKYTYDLARLHMTGRSWCHVDEPAAVAQYFVSELHAGEFSPAFQAAAARVLSTGADPLDARNGALLAELATTGGLAFADAAALLPALVGCFRRQHGVAAVADYELLLAESAEMAWIATEGTAFNHATDRVADVEAVAAAERAAGRPVKDLVEVSGSGRILQTAHKAPLVTRPFRAPEGHLVEMRVPGSFFEFITRRPLPDGSGPDLAFDAANAQQIFTMTRG